jgi:prephenate dehydrogenase
LSNNSNLSGLRIAIVGLGLMGGSLAKALHRHVYEIVAVDPNRHSLEMALAQGVISQGTSDLRAGVAKADMVILATPVRLIVEILGNLPQLRTEGCFVMDLGSTKAEIDDAMSVLPDSFGAIGGHPMCGREQSGFQATSSSLYDGQTFILCRNRRTSQRAEDLAISIVEAIHAQPLFLDAVLHDEIVALTSHLPYLVAAMLTSRVAEEAMADGRYWQISATGLRDVSRLAGSNPQMMLDILNSNRQSILKQLQKLDVEMHQLIHALESDNFGAVSAWLQAAWRHHESYLERRWREPRQNQSNDVDE